MKTLLQIAALTAALACPARAADETLAMQLLAGYSRIESVNCRVRKTSSVDGTTAQMLSRVYYQKPDRLHVENLAPFKRRIIADGTNFYYGQDNLPKALEKPLANLEEEWRIKQQAVPGTPMEHLLRLQGVPELKLAGVPGFPIRRGYSKPNVFVVLACDAEGRLARIEFFKSPEMKEKTAQYEYGDFIKAGADSWLACYHRADACFGTNTLHETYRFDNMIVNQPIAPSLFDAGEFFKGADFVHDFDELFR